MSKLSHTTFCESVGKTTERPAPVVKVNKDGVKVFMDDCDHDTFITEY